MYVLLQAQLEEKAILDKVSHKLGYANAVPNAISRLRGAAQANYKKTSNGKCSASNLKY